MAMLLRPNEHWVANTRSIWAYLLLKHGSLSLAGEELQLYRSGAQDSEMAYPLWCDIHARMKPSTEKLAELSSEVAKSKGLEAGAFGYLWSDAVSNALYEVFNKK
ncbi:hypothetical protein [Undibacterium curvum]|uniref:hypothetical protein n=1 Tax=Undibacterium curvum TaxID=2762294 RepID=UPI003D100D9F